MLLTMPLAAQIQGAISGYIRDSSGAVVPNAAVRIINEKTGATRNGLSADAGFYQVLGLISGTYTIEAEVSGFKKFRNAGVVLRVDENVRADIPLEVGQVSEAVEVSAQAALIDTSSRADMVANFFNRDVFKLADIGRYGSAGRNIFSGPAMVSTDLAILKNIQVFEQQSFQFRAEFFNMFNNVNFNNPVATLSSATYGRITGAQPGRLIQLGLKYIW